MPAPDYSPIPFGTGPLPFAGTDEERTANRQSHHYAGDDDLRCLGCDCRPGTISADYPCGSTVPRITL